MHCTRLLFLLLLISINISFLLFFWLQKTEHSTDPLLVEGRALIARLRPLPSPAVNCSDLSLDKYVTSHEVLPESVSLGHVTACLRAKRLLKADLSGRGSQLKLEVELEGGVRALFKPKRYPLETIIKGLYAGFDRHNGEIVAFHLSRLLGLPAPVVIANAFTFSDISRVSTLALQHSISVQCIRWRRQEVCVSGDVIEGALVVELPYRLKRTRSPWQRTYRNDTRALWETNKHFCLEHVLPRLPLSRVLEHVDASIFDFLIQNADRHHIERFHDWPDSTLLLIDNGKSFGDPTSSDLSILMPLIQCCRVRRETVHRLRSLRAVGLGSAIESLLRDDKWWPLITSEHLKGLDSRLDVVLRTVDQCLTEHNRLY